MQRTTDDASHDEALSSRVAALNMLDLGLGHLGIDVGESMNEPELNAVVKACGEREYNVWSKGLYNDMSTMHSSLTIGYMS